MNERFKPKSDPRITRKGTKKSRTDFMDRWVQSWHTLFVLFRVFRGSLFLLGTKRRSTNYTNGHEKLFHLRNNRIRKLSSVRRPPDVACADFAFLEYPQHRVFDFVRSLAFPNVTQHQYA